MLGRVLPPIFAGAVNDEHWTLEGVACDVGRNSISINFSTSTTSNLPASRLPETAKGLCLTSSQPLLTIVADGILLAD